MRLKRPSVHVARGVTTPARRRRVRVNTQVARAIDRALSGEMVKTLTPAARGDGDGSVLCGNQPSGARRASMLSQPNSLVDTYAGAPRHVKHAHKAKKPDALVLALSLIHI